MFVNNMKQKQYTKIKFQCWYEFPERRNFIAGHSKSSLNNFIHKKMCLMFDAKTVCL